MLILVVLAMIHLAIYVQNMGIGYESAKLKKKLGELRSRNRYLWSIVARKESLSRIERIATTKLKMVRPEEIHYLTISGSSSVPSSEPSTE